MGKDEDKQLKKEGKQLSGEFVNLSCSRDLREVLEKDEKLEAEKLKGANFLKDSKPLENHQPEKGIGFLTTKDVGKEKKQEGKEEPNEYRDSLDFGNFDFADDLHFWESESTDDSNVNEFQEGNKAENEAKVTAKLSKEKPRELVEQGQGPIIKDTGNISKLHYFSTPINLYSTVLKKGDKETKLVDEFNLIEQELQKESKKENIKPRTESLPRSKRG